MVYKDYTLKKDEAIKLLETEVTNLKHTIDDLRGQIDRRETLLQAMNDEIGRLRYIFIHD